MSYELAEIRKISINVALIQTTATTARINAEDLSFTLTSEGTFRGPPLTLKLDKAFIEELYTLPPSDRGLRILEKALFLSSTIFKAHLALLPHSDRYAVAGDSGLAPANHNRKQIIDRLTRLKKTPVVKAY